MNENHQFILKNSAPLLQITYKKIINKDHLRVNIFNLNQNIVHRYIS